MEWIYYLEPFLYPLLIFTLILSIYAQFKVSSTFKKYSKVGEVDSFATNYADALQKASSSPIFICDRDSVIAVSGASKRDYMDRRISRELEEIIETRSLYMKASGQEPVSVIHDGGSHYVNCAMPILSDGDVVGCVLSAWQYDLPTNTKIQDSIESKLIQTAGIFLGKQIE